VKNWATRIMKGREMDKRNLRAMIALSVLGIFRDTRGGKGND